MEIRIMLKPRSGSCYAEGIYVDGKVTVLKGGRINTTFANHIRGGKMAKVYRDSEEYVDSKGLILTDCVFNSPSTAAQFVTGCSTNGYEVWKVDGKKRLGRYLKEMGIR